MERYVLKKEDVTTVYFKCKNKAGCTYTSSIKDAMKFEFETNAIDFNFENLYGECVVEELGNIEIN